ncbi:MAG TPA: SPOR domain-containing protein [Steroidobacteraceae bacterium]|nr:SPOR domain-containing protein [Steroidobacteraceae bacterium]
MRNAFIALLVVNLVYFAWAQWIDEPRTPPVNEALAKLPRLKLISELPPEQRPATNTRTVLNETPACMSVGPFGDITNAAKAAGILTAKGFAPQQRAEEAGTSTGYWVYVGALKDDVEADKMRVSLEKAGVKDALVMPPGGDAGRRISLGLFSDRAHADQRATSLKRLGFKAEVAEHKLPQVVYWIDLTPRPGMTTVPLADLFAEGVGSRIAVQPCPPPPPPSATAAAQPAGAAPVAQPPAATEPKYPLPSAPAPPAGSPPATHIAATPKPAAAGTPR